MSPAPKVKAFLLCDHALQSTDFKHSVIGIFQRIHATEFPVFHHRFGIYLRLGEMRGDYTLLVRFVDPNSERVLAEAKLQGIKHNRPLEDFESAVNLPGIEIPHDGIFEVRVFANGDLIHVDTLRAVKVTMGEAAGSEAPRPDVPPTSEDPGEGFLPEAEEDDETE